MKKFNAICRFTTCFVFLFLLITFGFFSCTREIDSLVAESAPIDETDSIPEHYVFAYNFYGADHVRFDIDLDSNGVLDAFYDLYNENFNAADYAREKLVITNPDWEVLGYLRTDTFCVDTVYSQDSLTKYPQYTPCGKPDSDSSQTDFYETNLVHEISPDMFSLIDSLQSTFVQDSVIFQLFDPWEDTMKIDKEITKTGTFDGSYVIFQHISTAQRKAIFIQHFRNDFEVWIGKNITEI